MRGHFWPFSLFVGFGFGLTKCLPPIRADTRDPPLQGERKTQRLRGDVDLPARVPVPGGVGEATCAACCVSGFMIVVHSRRSGRTQISLESAEEFVTVGRKKMKAATVGNIWRVLAEVLVKFSGPGERSQVGRISEKGRVCVNSALVDRLLSFNASRESPVERHLVAG